MKVISVAEAAALVKDNFVIGSAVQGMTGWPEEIALAIEKRFLETGHPANITNIHGAGNGDFARTSTDGKTCRGECVLAHDGLLGRSIHGHVGCSFKVTSQIVQNKILAYNFPLGMIGQIWREQGRGFPGLMTKVGLGTFMDPRFDGCKVNQKTRDEGGDLVEYIPDFRGEEYLFYTLPPLNIALLRATTSDMHGNLTYEKECMPCEPLDLAMACKAAGGIVVAQVERLAITGSLDPRNIRIPGILVDYVCVSEHPENTMQTHVTHFNPSFTGEIKAPVSSNVEPLPLNEEKGVQPPRRRGDPRGRQVQLRHRPARPSAQHPGGRGRRRRRDHDLRVRPDRRRARARRRLRRALQPHSEIARTDHFSFFDQGGLDVAVFGLSEVDKDGNVNTTFLNGKMAGVGGFPNIAANAKHSIFVGTFTAHGIKCHVEDGKMVIDHEGQFKKFVNSCVQISFSAEQAIAKGNKISFITERCVIVRKPEGLVLTEIAPGIDLQTQILDQMEFKPIIPEGGPKLMDPAIFQENWGKLSAMMRD